MKNVPFAEASPAQLREFATLQLGLEVAPTMTGSRLRALIEQAGYTKDFIELDEPEPSPARQDAPSVSTEPRKTQKILIPSQPGPGGKEAVPVGVNGRVARIMRGVPVDVPVEYIEVLKNAQTVEYDLGPNGEPINPQLVPKHPFSILQG